MEAGCTTAFGLFSTTLVASHNLWKPITTQIQTPSSDTNKSEKLPPCPCGVGVEAIPKMVSEKIAGSFRAHKERLMFFRSEYIYVVFSFQNLPCQMWRCTTRTVELSSANSRRRRQARCRHLPGTPGTPGCYRRIEWC